MASKSAQVIALAIVIGIVVPIGIAVIDPIATTAPNPGGTTAKDVDVLLGSAGEFVSVPGDPGEGTNEVVKDSRNFSLRFAGTNDSYLSADADLSLSNKSNWTVGTGVWINDSAVGNDNMTVFAAGDPDLFLRYHNKSGQQANYSAYIINPTSTHVINVSAPDPTNATYIFVERNGSNVTIYRHNSTDSETGEEKNTSLSSTFTGDLTVSQNLDGRVDESRFWNKSLTSSERTTVADDPVAPFSGGNRTARLMYDAGSGSTVRIFFASADATAFNASYATGYQGEVLSESGDYDWRSDGPEIAPEANGKLDPAPIAFVAYNLNVDEAELATEGIADAFELLGLVPLILILVLTLRHIRKKY